MINRVICAALLALPIALAACTAPDEPPQSATASSAVVPATPAPELAGPDEAALLADLPTGPAAGDVVLAYGGVGELRSPFAGTCDRFDGTTTISGSADTASIDVEIAPGGARVVLVDTGFSATSQLGAGSYAVDGGHLSLQAPLAQNGEVVGSADLEIDCG